METKVAKHFFAYGNTKYFRGKAENVEIGAFGEKKDPIGANAYLAVEGKVARRNLKGRVRYVTRARVDWARTSKADYEAQGKVTYFTIGASGGLTATYEKAKTARLELLKFAIDEGPLKKMLNDDAGAARAFLKKEGNDGRIVSEVWVVVDAEIAETFASAAATNGSVTASLTDALELEASAGKSGSAAGHATIVFEPRTTFAYLMHKVKKWDKDEVADLEDDRKGMG